MSSNVMNNYRLEAANKLKKLAARLTDRRRKLMWRLTTQRSGDTAPVFIFGAQRSGTTMLGKCLGKNPEIENLGEGDRRAFAYYSLRDLDIVSSLVRSTPYRFLVFKPLKDSHRVDELLMLRSNSKAIWAYRNYADRVNSAVKAFGRHPLDVFMSFQESGKMPWQLQGLSEEDRKQIKELNFAGLTEHDGAALMWYVRNKLYFNQELQANSRVFLLSYDAFVTDAYSEMRTLAGFLQCKYLPYMVDGVYSNSLNKDRAPQIDPEIEQLCLSLHRRFETVRRNQNKELAAALQSSLTPMALT